MNLQKFRDGLLFGMSTGLGLSLVIGIVGIAYASFGWVTQSDVTSGGTLTATAWNDLLNNQNYLKQEVESKVTKAGDVMAGILDMGSNKITNAATPTANNDVANKAYVDTVSAAGGIYQVSCYYQSNNGYNICLRMNTTTGLTECRMLNYGYVGGPAQSSNPWGNCVNNSVTPTSPWQPW